MRRDKCKAIEKFTFRQTKQKMLNNILRNENTTLCIFSSQMLPKIEQYKHFRS